MAGPVLNSDHAPRSETLRLSASLIILGLVLIACLIARVRLLDLPLERDEGEYAYGAQILSQGGVLYRDIHSMKWPGMYAAYAGIFSLLGENVRAIHTGLLLGNLLSALGLWLFCRSFSSAVQATFSATFFLLLMLLPVMHGIIANAEHFAVLFITWGLAAAAWGLKSRRLSLLLLSGGLLGLAVIMKQHAIFNVALACCVVLCLSGSKRRSLAVPLHPAEPEETSLPAEPRRTVSAAGLSRGFATLLLGTGIALAWIVMALALWRQGAWNDFVLWTIKYPRSYTSQISLMDAPILFVHSARPISLVIWPVLMLALAGGISVWKQAGADQQFWLLGGLLAGLLSICPGFYFREHYYLMLMPSIACLAGAGVQAVSQHCMRQVGASGRWMALAVVVFACLWPLGVQGRLLYAQSLRDVSRTMYGPNPFVESPEIAAYLKRVMPPGSRLVILGSEPQIAFESGHRLATGDVYMYPLMEHHPLALPMQREMIREVEAARPEFVVLVSTRTSWLQTERSEPLLMNWIPEFLKKYNLIGLVKTVSFEETVSRYSEDATPLFDRSLTTDDAPHNVQIYRRKLGH
jgi:hypothetical protein